jgi:prepilin-type processing-associated H-X9-DG protein
VCPSPNPPTIDYAYNENLLNVKLAAVKAVAQCLVLMGGDRDQNSHAMSSGDWNYVIVNKATWWGVQTPAFVRHNEGDNYGFADGHVKWLKTEAVGANRTTSVGGATGGNYAAWFDPNAE